MRKIVELIKEHQDKIILSIGGIIIAIVAFGAGRFTKIQENQPELIITDENNEIEEVANNNEIDKNAALFGKYLASIEDNRYFTASAAKLAEIGEDKVIWFDSAEDAQEQGYVSNSNDSTDSADEEGSSESSASGKYVASKSGTKYYLPTCSGVSRIKEENKVWFDTIEEAEAEGLEPAKNCPGLSE